MINWPHPGRRNSPAGVWWLSISLHAEWFIGQQLFSRVSHRHQTLYPSTVQYRTKSPSSSFAYIKALLRAAFPTDANLDIRHSLIRPYISQYGDKIRGSHRKDRKRLPPTFRSTLFRILQSFALSITGVCKIWQSGRDMEKEWHPPLFPLFWIDIFCAKRLEISIISTRATPGVCVSVTIEHDAKASIAHQQVDRLSIGIAS